MNPTLGNTGEFAERVIALGRCLRSQVNLVSERMKARIEIESLLLYEDSDFRHEILVDMASWGLEIIELGLDEVDDDAAEILVTTRDDLESLRAVAAWSILRSVAMGLDTPVPAATLSRLNNVTDSMDRAAYNVMDRLLRWSAKGQFSPQWIIDCIERPSPWWMDLVDPVMVAIRKRSL